MLIQLNQCIKRGGGDAGLILYGHRRSDLMTHNDWVHGTDFGLTLMLSGEDPINHWTGVAMLELF